MPLYEFRCRTCDEAFEVRRPMSQANDPATCSAGHTDTLRMLSRFASVGAPSSSASAAPAPRMGGGCGPACGCGH